MFTSWNDVLDEELEPFGTREANMKKALLEKDKEIGELRRERDLLHLEYRLLKENSVKQMLQMTETNKEEIARSKIGSELACVDLTLAGLRLLEPFLSAGRLGQLLTRCQRSRDQLMGFGIESIFLDPGLRSYYFSPGNPLLLALAEIRAQDPVEPFSDMETLLKLLPNISEKECLEQLLTLAETPGGLAEVPIPDLARRIQWNLRPSPFTSDRKPQEFAADRPRDIQERPRPPEPVRSEPLLRPLFRSSGRKDLEKKVSFDFSGKEEVRPGIPNNDCCICFEEMKSKNTKTLAGCRHTFHRHCIKSWLEKKQDCPLCRRVTQI